MGTSLGPSGSEMPKKSRKCLLGPAARDPEKVSKKSRGQSKNTLQTLSGDSPKTSQTVPKTFRRLFGGPGPGGPALRAQRARETPVRRGLVPKPKLQKFTCHSPDQLHSPRARIPQNCCPQHPEFPSWRVKVGEPEGVRRYSLSEKVFVCFKKVLEGKGVSKKVSETF